MAVAPRTRTVHYELSPRRLVDTRRVTEILRARDSHCPTHEEADAIALIPENIVISPFKSSSTDASAEAKQIVDKADQSGVKDIYIQPFVSVGYEQNPKVTKRYINSGLRLGTFMLSHLSRLPEPKPDVHISEETISVQNTPYGILHALTAYGATIKPEISDAEAIIIPVISQHYLSVLQKSGQYSVN